MEPQKAMVDKKEKHLVIEEALEGLRNALGSLDTLRCKIQGAPTVQPDKTDQAVLSLSEFLNASPEEINRISGEIHKNVNDIREMLF